MARLKLPTIEQRKARARAAYGRWAVPSHDPAMSENMHRLRHDLTWQDGYESALRDVRKNLQRSRGNTDGR